MNAVKYSFTFRLLFFSHLTDSRFHPYPHHQKAVAWFVAVLAIAVCSALWTPAASSHESTHSGSVAAVQASAYLLGAVGASLLVKNTKKSRRSSPPSTPQSSPQVKNSSSNPRASAEHIGGACVAMSICYVAWNVLQRSLFQQHVSATEWLVLDKLIGSWWMLLYVGLSRSRMPQTVHPASTFTHDLKASVRTSWHSKWTMLAYLALQFSRIGLGFIFVGPTNMDLAAATLLSVLARMVASNVITSAVMSACPSALYLPSNEFSSKASTSSRRCKISKSAVGNGFTTIAMLLALVGTAGNRHASQQQEGKRGAAKENANGAELIISAANDGLSKWQSNVQLDFGGAAVVNFAVSQLGRKNRHRRSEDMVLSSALLVGDFGCTPSTSVQSCLQNPLAQREVAVAMHKSMLLDGIEKPSFVMNLGDAAYDAGVSTLAEAALVEAHHKRIYELDSKMRGTPWYGIVGNHDYLGSVDILRTGAESLGLDPFRTGKLYYEWKRPINKNGGVAHLIALDTSYAQAEDICKQQMARLPDALSAPDRVAAIESCKNNFAMSWSKQLAWLTRTLAANEKAKHQKGVRKQWTVVFGHNPIYATGKWAFYNSNATALKMDLLPVMKVGSVDAYVCAHDHVLQLLSSDDDAMLFGIFGGGGANLDDEPSKSQNGINVLHTLQSHGFGMLRFNTSLNKSQLCLSVHPVQTFGKHTSSIDDAEYVPNASSSSWEVTPKEICRTSSSLPGDARPLNKDNNAATATATATDTRAKFQQSAADFAAASAAAADETFRRWKSKNGVVIKTLECLPFNNWSATKAYSASGRRQFSLAECGKQSLLYPANSFLRYDLPISMYTGPLSPVDKDYRNPIGYILHDIPTKLRRCASPLDWWSGNSRKEDVCRKYFSDFTDAIPESIRNHLNRTPTPKERDKYTQINSCKPTRGKRGAKEWVFTFLSRYENRINDFDKDLVFVLKPRQEKVERRKRGGFMQFSSYQKRMAALRGESEEIRQADIWKSKHKQKIQSWSPFFNSGRKGGKNSHCLFGNSDWESAFTVQKQLIAGMKDVDSRALKSVEKQVAHIWSSPGDPSSADYYFGYLPFQTLNEVHAEPLTNSYVSAVFYLNLTSTAIPFKTPSALATEAEEAMIAATELAKEMTLSWNRRVPVIQLNGLEHGNPAASFGRSKKAPERLPVESADIFLPLPLSTIRLA